MKKSIPVPHSKRADLCYIYKPDFKTVEKACV